MDKILKTILVKLADKQNLGIKGRIHLGYFGTFLSGLLIAINLTSCSPGKKRKTEIQLSDSADQFDSSKSDKTPQTEDAGKGLKRAYKVLEGSASSKLGLNIPKEEVLSAAPDGDREMSLIDLDSAQLDDKIKHWEQTFRDRWTKFSGGLSLKKNAKWTDKVLGHLIRDGCKDSFLNELKIVGPLFYSYLNQFKEIYSGLDEEDDRPVNIYVYDTEAMYGVFRGAMILDFLSYQLLARTTVTCGSQRAMTHFFDFSKTNVFVPILVEKADCPKGQVSDRLSRSGKGAKLQGKDQPFCQLGDGFRSLGKTELKKEVKDIEWMPNFGSGQLNYRPKPGKTGDEYSDLNHVSAETKKQMQQLILYDFQFVDWVEFAKWSDRTRSEEMLVQQWFETYLYEDGLDGIENNHWPLLVVQRLNNRVDCSRLVSEELGDRWIDYARSHLVGPDKAARSLFKREGGFCSSVDNVLLKKYFANEITFQAVKSLDLKGYAIRSNRLHLAAARGEVERVIKILELGVNANKLGIGDRTLKFKKSNGTSETYKFSNYSPLHFAVLANQGSSLRALLENTKVAVGLKHSGAAPIRISSVEILTILGKYDNSVFAQSRSKKNSPQDLLLVGSVFIVSKGIFRMAHSKK